MEKYRILNYFAIISLVILLIIYKFYRQCKNRVFSMVTKYAPTSKKILDLGCGACCISKQLQLSGREVTPMDVVDKGVCLKPELFDGMKIPYADKVFDLGICSYVLHHTDNQELLLKELQRVCKKILLIENTPSNKVEWEYAFKHAKSEWGKCEKCFKDDATWMEEFNKLGIKVVAKETMSKWVCPFSDQPFFYPVTSTVFILE